MADTCLCCNDELTDEDGTMKCAECGYNYHFGSCSGVSESTFKSKGEIWRKAWRCLTCRTAKSRSSQGEKPRQDESNLAAVIIGINQKLSTLMELKDTVSAIEVSVNMMSTQYDEILKQMRQHDTEIKDLKKRMTNMENREKEVNVQQMTQDINALEWQTRKMNLEFHGIPVSERENLNNKINQVAEKLGVPVLTDSEIVAMHRLPARTDKIPGIIVHFAKQSTRDQWLKKRKNLDRTGKDGYILENLTRQNRALLWTAKEWAKQHDYRYSWHRNGKIFVRRKEGDAAILIKCEMDLERLT